MFSLEIRTCNSYSSGCVGVIMKFLFWWVGAQGVGFTPHVITVKMGEVS